MSESKWDHFLDAFVTNSEIKMKFHNEVENMEFLINTAAISGSLLYWLNSLEDNIMRSDKKSEYYRMKGNTYYKEGRRKEQQLSTLYYTYAILTAPENSINKSLAHANRSLSLMDLELFEDAYNDCLMSINLNYPKDRIHKLFERQMFCATKLKNGIMITQIIKNAEQMNKEMNNKAVTKKKLDEFRRINFPFCDKQTPELLPSKNDHLIEKHSLEKGRFMITDKEIKKNELFLIEEAFAFVPVIDPESKIDYDCQNCAKVNVIPFPCPKCSKSTYCSPQCMKLHENVHVTECQGYILNLWYELGIAHLSVRTLLCGIKSLIEELSKNNSTNENPKDLFNAALQISEKNIEFKYGRVLRLVTNIELMNSNDFLKYSLTAAMITVYLKNYTDFFANLMLNGNDLLSSENDWQLFVGALIMRHMGQLISNGHVISDLRNTIWCHDNSERIGGNKPIIGSLHYYFRNSRVFTGIFANVSLFNHSCDPNICYRFNENKLMVFASRNISKNLEILNCYGPNYKLQSRKNRQNALKEQYSFHCKCNRCCVSSDEDYLMFRYYKCQTEKCDEKIIYDENWWQTPNFIPVIKCPKCFNIVTLSWYQDFDEITARPENISIALFIYNQCKINLSPSHDLKQEIAERILYMFTEYSVHFNEDDRLYEIAVELINMKKEKYGIMSLEHILSATYLLDILALRKRDNIKNKYDLTEIISSFKILSSQARIIFDNYIDFHV